MLIKFKRKNISNLEGYTQLYSVSFEHEDKEILTYASYQHKQSTSMNFSSSSHTRDKINKGQQETQ